MSELLSVRVVRKLTEALDVCLLELASEDGAPLPEFAPGAHVDVHLGDRLCRQYSLCTTHGMPRSYQIAVLREPRSRGGSQAVHDRIGVGDVLRIGRPRNLFPLSENDQPALLFAGGIGITPILCMAEFLAARNRRFALHYCGRTAERMAFRDRLLASGFSDRVHIHTDDGPADQRLDLAALLDATPRATHLYVCGPSGFIDAVVAEANQRGWDPGCVHVERFAADTAGQDSDTEFEVRLASTGQQFTVGADETVVEALARHGVTLETSCEQGICGTCLTQVVDGIPDHRDCYLSDREKSLNDQFLPCCSRAKSRLLVLKI